MSALALSSKAATAGGMAASTNLDQLLLLLQKRLLRRIASEFSACGLPPRRAGAFLVNTFDTYSRALKAGTGGADALQRLTTQRLVSSEIAFLDGGGGSGSKRARGALQMQSSGAGSSGVVGSASPAEGGVVQSLASFFGLQR